MSGVEWTKTQAGQLVYDLAFVDRSDKYLARKHGLPIAEIRSMRSSAPVSRLRRIVDEEKKTQIPSGNDKKKSKVGAET